MTNPSPSNPELLPCPFCGASGRMLRECDTTPAGQYWISCDSCSCEGPGYVERDLAITAWNQRSNLPSDGAVGELERDADFLHGLSLALVEIGKSAAATRCGEISERLTTLTRLAAGQSADAKRIEALEGELLNHRAHAERTMATFKERMGDRDRPTWFAVNVLQDFVDFVLLWNIYDSFRARQALSRKD